MRAWWAKTASRRNQPHCVCQCQEHGHLIATKRRGIKRFLGTHHQARHHTSCPHSELTITTTRLTRSQTRKARAIHALSQARGRL